MSWKIEIIENRKTKNAAIMEAAYCGGNCFFKFRNTVTLTDEGRKEFVEEGERRLKQHLQNLESVDRDLVSILEKEMNGQPFAVDVARKKKEAAELKDAERIAKAREKAEKDEERENEKEKEDPLSVEADEESKKKAVAEKIKAEKKKVTAAKHREFIAGKRQPDGKIK